MRTVSGCSAAGVLNSIQENVPTRKKTPVFKNKGRSQVPCSADDYDDIVNVFRRISMPSDDLAQRQPQYILCAANAPGIRHVLGRSQLIMNDLGRSSSDLSKAKKNTRHSTGLICISFCFSVLLPQPRLSHSGWRAAPAAVSQCQTEDSSRVRGHNATWHLNRKLEISRRFGGEKFNKLILCKGTYISVILVYLFRELNRFWIVLSMTICDNIKRCLIIVLIYFLFRGNEKLYFWETFYSRPYPKPKASSCPCSI